MQVRTKLSCLLTEGGCNNVADFTLREVDRKLIGKILGTILNFLCVFLFVFAIFEPRDPFQRVDRTKISQKSVKIIKNHFKISQNL